MTRKKFDVALEEKYVGKRNKLYAREIVRSMACGILLFVESVPFYAMKEKMKKGILIWILKVVVFLCCNERIYQKKRMPNLYQFETIPF